MNDRAVVKVNVVTRMRNKFCHVLEHDESYRDNAYQSNRLAHGGPLSIVL